MLPHHAESWHRDVMIKGDGDDFELVYEDDHNAHVSAWKHAQEENFNRWMMQRGTRPRFENRRTTKECLRERLYECRRRNEQIDKELKRQEKRFFAVVSDAKPYADFFTLISLHAFLSGFCIAIITRMFHSGWSTRSGILAGFLALYWMALFRPLDKASFSFIDMQILRLVRLLSLPNPPDITWVSIRSIWGLTHSLLYLALLLGPPFLGYDLSRHAIDQVTNSPAHNDVSPP